MINLLSESAYIAQTNKIKTAITNKVNAIKASFTRIGAKLGANINWLEDVESTLDDELTAINTELVDKGSTQAEDFSEVAEKISDIQTGITPTGQIAITQNGTYDVTDYASASVDVPSELVKLLNNELVELVIVEPVYYYNHNTVFSQQPNLEKVVIKNSSGTFAQQLFANCPKLKIVDIDGDSRGFNNAVFTNDASFDTLILRANHVWSMYGVTTFNNTPFRNGTGGTVYVPQALLSQYQNATNWSALESTTFLPIEGSIYE